jgi:hypothetical protein
MKVLNWIGRLNYRAFAIRTDGLVWIGGSLCHDRTIDINKIYKNIAIYSVTQTFNNLKSMMINKLCLIYFFILISSAL